VLGVCGIWRQLQQLEPAAVVGDGMKFGADYSLEGQLLDGTRRVENLLSSAAKEGNVPTAR